MLLFLLAPLYFVFFSTIEGVKYASQYEFNLLEELEVHLHKMDRLIMTMQNYYDNRESKDQRIYLRGFELLLKNARSKINKSIAHLENYEQDELTSEEKSRFPYYPITRRGMSDNFGDTTQRGNNNDLLTDLKNDFYKALLRALKHKIENTTPT